VILSSVNPKTEYLWNLDESSKSSETIIAKVTNCLSSHEKCTGRYIDFSSKYIVICYCQCHSKKPVTLDGGRTTESNVSDSLCHHMESSKDD
jgi:hypothetical protein